MISILIHKVVGIDSNGNYQKLPSDSRSYTKTNKLQAIVHCLTDYSNLMEQRYQCDIVDFDISVRDNI